ncbi:MBOAT family O-acyltransferase [Treponema sp.]|uniref:MBOAT family O-acyltransferase n=1 Tax=Treponema sp. TaxID=166 RepID=UPI003F0AF849
MNFHQAAKWFLVIASFAFYAIGSPRFVLIFMMSVAVNYLIGTKLSALKKQSSPSKKISVLCGILFALGIILNVSLLGYYKYTDFFISNFNAVFGKNVPLLHIVLPIGISFFTFQLIAYLVDSYRGLTAEYSFLDYLLFISFFPQLIVGPIVHHGEMVPQFEDKRNWKVNWDNVAKGVFVFTIGVAKKTLLANPLTANAQSFFDAAAGEVSALSAWWYSIEYTVSYYFDLSGYADMAIGIALMFNIIIPENFNSPYKARNFQDYWQRWHITLSRFLGAYIFRSVYKKDSKWRNYYVATMVTFFVSGFWHGAGWTFIVWGIINGIFVCTASWMKRKNLSFPTVISRTLTLLGIVLTRILFVSRDFSQALTVFKSLFRFDLNGFSVGYGISPLMIVRIVIACVIIFFMPSTHTLSERFKPQWKTLIPLALAAGLSVAFMGQTTSFLYFQF